MSCVVDINIASKMKGKMVSASQRWLPGNSESSVESLCWAPGPRLFSAGLHGLVLEHDLDALATKHQSAATSGAAWCMQYHRGRNREGVSVSHTLQIGVF